MSNPFLNIPHLPEFNRMDPESAREAFNRLIPETLEKIETLEESFTPTWEGLVRQLHDICRPVYDAWLFFEHLKSVIDNDDWRKVQDEFLPRIVTFEQRVSQSPALYRGHLRLRDADRAEPFLNDTQRHILEKTIRDFELSGVGLDPDKQQRFNAIQVRLSQASTDFANHVLDATKAFSMTLTTLEEVKGLPESLLEITAQAAADGKEFDAARGPWKITLDAAVYRPFMRYSENRAARELLFRKYNTRAASGDLDNSALIEEILKLRREMAQLLGFETYADLNLSTKMAKCVANVDSLVEELAEAAHPVAVRENAELLEFARSNGFAEDSFQPWDVAYWQERRRKALYDYDDEELSKYFQFPKVLDGLFKLAERLFGIKITPADGEAPVWHPDVRFFRISDADGTPRAAFYLDPYSRPATKRGGAWMNGFRNRDLTPDGQLELPTAVMVCNQTVPVGGRPAQMRFGEVETLFHEFGHSLQHNLTDINEPAAAGINGVEWDAVEIASQFMENWCYERDTLKGLSCHIDSGEPLPDELFDKVVAAKNYMAASAMMGQLYFGATDMDLYARYPKPEWPDANAVKEANELKFSPHPIFKEGRFLNTFTHIFAGGYAAGYYSYKWSEVISADAFAAFEEAGLDNESAIREIGRRYRATILGMGGSIPPDEVYRLFRGRDASTDAILRHCGLKD